MRKTIKATEMIIERNYVTLKDGWMEETFEVKFVGKEIDIDRMTVLGTLTAKYKEAEFEIKYADYIIGDNFKRTVYEHINGTKNVSWVMDGCTEYMANLDGVIEGMEKHLALYPL